MIIPDQPKMIHEKQKMNQEISDHNQKSVRYRRKRFVKGTEFTGIKFIEALEQEKIEEELTHHYTPEHNGTAKQFNGTIQRKVRAYTIDSGLSKNMWEVTVEAAVHVYNGTPHKSIEYEKPLERFAKM